MAMAANIYSYTREAVRVKVKKREPNIPPEWRKFSVDPQITSLDVLYSILAKAFDIKSDFSIKYKAFDPAGNEIYLAVLSDWDLDAAFLRIHNLSIQTSTEPCLILQIDIKPFTEVKDWDAETPLSATSGGTSMFGVSSSAGARDIIVTPLQQSLGMSQKYVQSMQTKLPFLIMNQMEKTFSIVQKAFNLSEETMSTLPPRAPLSDNEFRLFLDSLGQIQRSDELRKVIFLGGIEPSLRRVVWKHILNVYPNGMNGRQRMDYMKRKSDNYHKLRETWKAAIKKGCVVGELSYVTSMVKKDVLRTDRLHPFYAGSDDNQNIAALFNILTTYALNHPSVSYCQGMSDIASPLLVTMNDEAQAYICFCAIMSRVRVNFMLDGIAMTQKFSHLTEALSFYDPEFFEYLKAQQADDLLFCYRWLLLELKREFPFEDALRMLEVQWSSLKYETVDTELALYEKEFEPVEDTVAKTTTSPPISPSVFMAMTKPRENPYTKVCALRRQSSSASLSSLSSSYGTGGVGGSFTLTSAASHNKLDYTKRLNHSLDDSITRRRRNRNVTKAHQSLDETKMLMLIEGIANDDNPSIEQPSSKEFEAEESDADIRLDDETAATDANYFVFHPTNPFIEDALMNDTNTPDTLEPGQCSKRQQQQSHYITANAAFEDKCSAISNAFLSSDDGGSSCTSSVDDLTIAAKKKSNKGIINLHHKNIFSGYNAANNVVAKQITSGTNSGKRSGGGSGGSHFRDLKEKIVANSKAKGISSPITPDETTAAATGVEKGQQKLVKNFNEFMNFASLNKSRISDKLSKRNENEPTTTSYSNPHPLVKLTKGVSSFEESDSSAADTTWIKSTVATAMQNNIGVVCSRPIVGLHLELNCKPENAQSTTSASINFVHQQSPAEPSKINFDPSISPEDSQDQEYYPMSTAMTRELRLEMENLDRQVFGEDGCRDAAIHYSTVVADNSDIEYEKLGKDSMDLVEDLKEDEIIACPDISELIVRRRERDAKAKSLDATARHSTCSSSKSDVFVWENPLHQISNDSSCNNFNEIADVESAEIHDDSFGSNNARNQNDKRAAAEATMVSSFDSLNPFVVDALNKTELTASASAVPQVLVPTVADEATTVAEEITFAKTPAINECSGSSTELPMPSEFGGGNPFLMFLCLTLLLQHRNTIIKSGMDYNEIAMHFDKMVRKHDVTRVLNQARRMYIDYLKMQNAQPNGDDGINGRTIITATATVASEMTRNTNLVQHQHGNSMKS